MANKKLLFVDDDPAIRKLLQNYVSSFGFQCDTAVDGVDACEKLTKQQVAVVLTDMKMPRMDGMELLKYVKDTYPQIDVIVFTGHDDIYTYMDVIKAGASDFIVKPFNPDELEAKLNRVFREQKLVRQLERHSIYDALTDLYNRRYFDLKLTTEVQRADRQGYDLFLAFMDVDNFKGYNDQFGHQAGDGLLQALGKIMQQSVRENVDWPFRYGGDEFVVILTQVSLEQLLTVTSRILKKFAVYQFGNTGLSIGVAKFFRHHDQEWQDDISDVIARADKALYRAKEQTRGEMVLDEASEPPGK